MPSSVARKQLVSFLLLLISASANLWATDLKPEEILAKHLDSIGSKQARASLKSRVVQGAATYRVLVGGSGAIDGKFVFASEGQKSNFLFKINSNAYHGEQFICDGNKTGVTPTWSDKTRSEFGDFVLAQDILLKDNLLGGVWSAGWPLLNIDEHKSKLHAVGTKKLDGKELIGLRYQPKRGTDLDIVMYFDPQTYRHMMTIYSVSPPREISGGELGQAGKQQKRYSVEERFSEFQTVDGLNLPSHYDLRFNLETESGASKVIEWEVRALNINNNVSIDPRSFEVK